MPDDPPRSRGPNNPIRMVETVERVTVSYLDGASITNEHLLSRVQTCGRCGGPVHDSRRTIIASPEDDLWNDRIEFECEGRLLARMAR